VAFGYFLFAPLLIGGVMQRMAGHRSRRLNNQTRHIV
jgi:hypothetical protein